ncbi:MAG TPA: dTDP-4-dehydrorhamnose 3,5-epimerase [Bacteroidales bacterium]|nr:dTDP-4-dehydrorhamnose 3,5-epimerase [Bacteroidales bacterium]
MEFVKSKIEGLIIIKPKVFEDARGYFFESYNYNYFREAGINVLFLQDNQSKSNKNVIRGLHFQKSPFAQGKLVRVIKGAVLDVAVDIRINSPYYGKWEMHELSEKNKLMFYIPPGFAHGFLTLEDDTIFAYKCTNFYSKVSEGIIAWNDPILNINWGIQNPILSERDSNAPLFKDFVSPFTY